MKKKNFNFSSVNAHCWIFSDLLLTTEAQGTCWQNVTCDVPESSEWVSAEGNVCRGDHLAQADWDPSTAAQAK